MVPIVNAEAHPSPAATAPTPVVGAAASTAGDVTAGRQVFRKCQVCHSLDAGKNLVGPSLARIVGKKSAADPNFAYSPAMKQAGVTWSRDTLDAYLADPQKST
jgi:nitrite reductase (NO-forming)